MRRQRGFSLIEVMVVVVILGILASIIVPRLMGRPDEARKVKAQQDVLAIQNALELYKLDNGHYPTTDEGLSSLVQKPSDDATLTKWSKYLNSVPRDPWGRDYLYLYPGEHSDVDIFTFGADGQPGGKGANADIGNWDDRK